MNQPTDDLAALDVLMAEHIMGWTLREDIYVLHGETIHNGQWYQELEDGEWNLREKPECWHPTAYLAQTMQCLA